MSSRRQAVIGVTLALALVGAWLALHVYGVFFYSFSSAAVLIAPLLVALITWLNVGLFIVAHDAIHGSLVPGRRGVNLWFGRIALVLYAGFRFGRLEPKHLEHHRAPGTGTDPDFNAAHPTRLWPWYRQFMRRYFGATEFLTLSLAVAAYLLIGARIANLLLFWAIPAILSSLQLFYFGTYRPHRHESRAFADSHNARTNEFGWFASLISCFHFGYHHEHHLSPHVPWWRLPAERKARAIARSGQRPARLRPNA